MEIRNRFAELFFFIHIISTQYRRGELEKQQQQRFQISFIIFFSISSERFGLLFARYWQLFKQLFISLVFLSNRFSGFNTPPNAEQKSRNNFSWEIRYDDDDFRFSIQIIVKMQNKKRRNSNRLQSTNNFNCLISSLDWNFSPTCK